MAVAECTVGHLLARQGATVTLGSMGHILQLQQPW